METKAAKIPHLHDRIGDRIRLRSELTRQVPGRPFLRADSQGGIWQFSERSKRWKRIKIRWSKTYGTRVSLALPCGRTELVDAAALLLESWSGPRPDGKGVVFINDDPNDLRLENLLWGTLPPEERAKANRLADRARTIRAPRKARIAGTEEFEKMAIVIYGPRWKQRLEKLRVAIPNATVRDLVECSDRHSFKEAAEASCLT
jgi:hypothetical protein